MDFYGKTVEDAITEACKALGVTSENLEYEVVEEGSSGFLGLGSKQAHITASAKVTSPVDTVEKFLDDVLSAMNIEATLETEYDAEAKTIDVNLVGEDTGMLIGKRGATLDSLQYLVSLVVNKESEEYIRVKVDTENYRERRKATLENLAKNVASKVKKSGRPYELEPMNPYERRIIHSALQGNDYVTTHSEGEDQDRHVVVTLKEGVKPTGEYNRRDNRRGRRY